MEAIQSLVNSAPPDATVPVRWLAELLADADADRRTPLVSEASGVDLTVAQVAARFGKGSSTIRTWLARGALPGAYRLHGREWRVPTSAIDAMQRAEAARHRASTKIRTGMSRPGNTDLGEWRKYKH